MKKSSTGDLSYNSVIGILNIVASWVKQCANATERYAISQIYLITPRKHRAISYFFLNVCGKIFKNYLLWFLYFKWDSIWIPIFPIVLLWNTDVVLINL